MNREEATQEAERLTLETGIYHCAVRDTGDWYQASDWHVECSMYWGIRVK